VHYRFIGKDEFDSMRESGLLLETAEVHGNLYGTPVDEVAPWLAKGWTVILDVDQQGFRAIRSKMAATGIFVMPPSLAHLDARLRARATECDETLGRRLNQAAAEVAAAQDYDHVVVNDDLDRAVRQAEDIINLAAPAKARPDGK
jgi:guanylate kinase